MAYLIKEGCCIFQSTRSPLLESSTNNRTRRKLLDVDLRTKRGFLSATTSIYQFGILEKNQWAGEERILKDHDESAGYSIIARTNVKAFAIRKEDARKKFTREIMQFIVSIVEQRYIWLRERAQCLSQASLKVANMDPSNFRYDENLAELSKRFPTANPYVLTNIRKKSIIAQLSEKPSVLPIKNPPAEFESMMSRTINIRSARGTSESVPRTARDQSGSFQPLSSVFISPRGATAAEGGCVEESKSPLGGSVSAGFFTSRRRRHTQMSLAASASHLLHEEVLAPRFVVRKEKPRTASTGAASRRGNVKIEERLNMRFREEMSAKNLNKFVVGRRVIKLEDIARRRRPATPNPFARFVAGLSRPAVPMRPQFAQ